MRDAVFGALFHLNKKYMNKLFILCLLLISVLNVQAQDFQGKKSIGLKLNASNSQSNSQSGHYESSLTVEPGFGYFITNRWRLGTRLNLSVSNRKVYYDQIEAGVTNTHTIGLEAFATYYHWFAKNMAFFVEPTIGYLHGKVKQKDEYREQETDLNTYHVDSKVGFMLVILNQRLGIDLSTSLLSAKLSQSDTNIANIQGADTKQRNLKVDFLGGGISNILNNMSLGVKYFF